MKCRPIFLVEWAITIRACCHCEGCSANNFPFHTSNEAGVDFISMLRSRRVRPALAKGGYQKNKMLRAGLSNRRDSGLGLAVLGLELM